MATLPACWLSSYTPAAAILPATRARKTVYAFALLTVPSRIKPSRLPTLTDDNPIFTPCLVSALTAMDHLISFSFRVSISPVPLLVPVRARGRINDRFCRNHIRQRQVNRFLHRIRNARVARGTVWKVFTKSRILCLPAYNSQAGSVESFWRKDHMPGGQLLHSVRSTSILPFPVLDCTVAPDWYGRQPARADGQTPPRVLPTSRQLLIG